MEFDSLRLESQLCFPLYVCSKEIIRRYKPFLDPLHLTYTQYIVMLVLWEKDEVNVKTLGDKVFLDSGTLTPLLRKLEDRGYITMEKSSGDERNKIITITPLGRELKELAKDIPEQMGRCLSISPEEAFSLYQILYKIVNSFEKIDTSLID